MALKSTIDLTCNDYISNFEFDVFTRFTYAIFCCFCCCWNNIYCSHIMNMLIAGCSNPGQRCLETGKFLLSPTLAMWLSLPMMRCPSQPYLATLAILLCLPMMRCPSQTYLSLVLGPPWLYDFLTYDEVPLQPFFSFGTFPTPVPCSLYNHTLHSL